MPTAGRFDHDTAHARSSVGNMQRKCPVIWLLGLRETIVRSTKSRENTEVFERMGTRCAPFSGPLAPLRKNRRALWCGPVFLRAAVEEALRVAGLERAARGRPGPVEGWSYVARDGHATSERLGLFFNCRGEASIQRPRSAARCRVPSDPAAVRHPTAARFIGARAHVHRRQQAVDVWKTILDASRTRGVPRGGAPGRPVRRPPWRRCPGGQNCDRKRGSFSNRRRMFGIP